MPLIPAIAPTAGLPSNSKADATAVPPSQPIAATAVLSTAAVATVEQADINPNPVTAFDFPLHTAFTFDGSMVPFPTTWNTSQALSASAHVDGADLYDPLNFQADVFDPPPPALPNIPQVTHDILLASLSAAAPALSSPVSRVSPPPASALAARVSPPPASAPATHISPSPASALVARVSPPPASALAARVSPPPASTPLTRGSPSLDGSILASVETADIGRPRRTCKPTRAPDGTLNAPAGRSTTAASKRKEPINVGEESGGQGAKRKGDGSVKPSLPAKRKKNAVSTHTSRNK